MKHIKLKRLLISVILLIIGTITLYKYLSNNTLKKPLFILVNNSHANITFVNNLEYTEKFNTYTYRNFYNGAGVGLGDFNNDGLSDIYFCGNMVDNKLYINKGDFRFEDITDNAGVACSGAWSTGVSIADINGDGWLDIYVSKSGDPESNHRKNELFINNGDLTFSERASEFGLAFMGLSNHASFFDYDRDGDLDCYLLNNSFQSVTEYDITDGQRDIRDTLGANKLLKNEGGHYVDVSESAGIYGSKIGFGLGVSVGDINRDNWPDIYISNDFFERDYLYINNHDGTFTESLEDQMREISLGAMGSDIADINNDGYPDIFVTEMTPEDNSRLKTKAMFENWERYQMKLRNGYYHQFARNVLQLNNKNGSFSEIGRLSGVNKTDWSWGALLMDLDNDGWKDIFVANGIYKDLLDRDYLDIYSNPSLMRAIINTEEQAIMKIIDMIPSVKVTNYAFHNNGDLTFTNLSKEWGLNTPSFSNGAAYGDLDNDGDLDLVINNVNMPPFIYKNETSGISENNYIKITLKGKDDNCFAVGAAATLYCQGRIYFQEAIPARGFMSSSDNSIHFGLGSSDLIDSLIVNWPNGESSIYYSISANQILNLDQHIAEKEYKKFTGEQKSVLFQKTKPAQGLTFVHRENDFSDFERDRLLFQMLSGEGPHMAIGDVNGDDLEDFFICGSKDSPGELFVQLKQGIFERTNISQFEKDKISEDTDCAFFDADGDGDHDLYVASGGNEFPTSSSALSDRLYFNDGRGIFIKSDQILPAGKYESTSCVQPSDYDKDGDIDLFVGIRLLPFSYGVPVSSYLLENDGKGNFLNVTETLAPGLINAGMVTDMTWADIDNDNDPDMVIVGDWMPVKIMINNKNVFSDESEQYISVETEGWWHTIAARDINSDGHIDFVLGNQGLNSIFKASTTRPVTMYVNDFDLNGNIEQIICTFNGNKSFPVAMKDDLVKQIPSLENKYKKFDDYKNQTMEDIFPSDVLKKSIVLQAKVLESCIMMNSGKGHFSIKPLPLEAQLTPVYAISADDYDMDGIPDLILGGNQYRAKPETGINDAGYGLLLKGTKDQMFKSVSSLESGLNTKGEIRDLKKLTINGIRFIAVARNNDNLEFYKY